jgi:hypothetical protein
MPGRKILRLGWDAADREYINPLLEDGLNAYQRSALSKGLALDGDNARAFFGVSTVCHRRSDNQQTVMYAPRRESGIEEVVHSQPAMIDRRATKTAEIDSAQVKRGLRAHRDEI